VFAVPFPLVPMAPALARPPFDRDGWVYEEKVDGWRMLAYKEGARVRLISRNAVDHTHRFRELASVIAALKVDTAVLDGEIAVFDENLVSRFQLVGDSETGLVSTPPVFIAFDVLQVGSEDLRRRPLADRRPVLEDLIHNVPLVFPCRRLPDSGAKAWDIVTERGYEGMVAKDPRSTYRSGATRAWIKVKVRHEAIFAVGGIRDANAFDGALIGEEIEGKLHYRGVVEWGYRAADVLELLGAARMLDTRTSPFVDLRAMRGAVWLEPRLRAEISYAEVVDGRLRAPLRSPASRMAAAGNRLANSGAPSGIMGMNCHSTGDRRR
jgi:bifunctional non-homologous end joining protein LigD